MKMDVPD